MFQTRSQAQAAGVLSVVLFLWLSCPSNAMRDFTHSTAPTFTNLAHNLRATRLIVKSKLHNLTLAEKRFSVVHLDDDADIPKSLEHYNNHEDVEYAVKDSILWATATPDDTDYRFQWGLPRVGAPAAWDIATGASTEAGAVTVCITDSGIDASQPDLVGNLHPHVGYSAITKNSNVSDGLQHGTHVAGIVGAMGNNSLMVTGMNWNNILLLACKFLNDDGFGYASDAIDCIEYCISMGANIITNSWAGSEANFALKDAIKAAGDKNILFVVAAGNAGADLNQNASYPASFASELLNMVVVGSIGYNDTLSKFSNYGSNAVHLAAPGEWILSTVPDNSTAYFSGTSMAAPLVAGAAALALGASNKTLSALQLKQLLLDTVEPLPSLVGKVSTGGIVRADKAVHAAVHGGGSALEAEPVAAPPSGEQQPESPNGFAALQLAPSVRKLQLVL